MEQHTNAVQQVKIENPVWFGVQIAIGMGVVLPILLAWIGGSLFGIGVALVSPESASGPTGIVMSINALVVIGAGIIGGILAIQHKSTKITVGFATMALALFVIAMFIGMFV